MRTQDVTQKTCWRRWTIGKSGERWSRISMLAARHDDDDGNLTPSVMCRFPLFISSFVHFSIPNSIPISWLYFYCLCYKVTNSFSFLAVWCRPCTSSRWSFLAIYWVCIRLSKLLLVVVVLVLLFFFFCIWVPGTSCGLLLESEWYWVSLSLQRCSQHILHPQLTELC